MRKETKKMIVKDIIELVKWCRKNGKKDYGFFLNKHGQVNYLGLGLLERTLMNKKKEVLDNLREDILERVVYA